MCIFHVKISKSKKYTMLIIYIVNIFMKFMKHGVHMR